MAREETSDEIKRLLEQNDNLRAVISQMRGEMETLGAQFPAGTPTTHRNGKNDSVTTGMSKSILNLVVPYKIVLCSTTSSRQPFMLGVHN